MYFQNEQKSSKRSGHVTDDVMSLAFLQIFTAVWWYADSLQLSG